MLKKVIHWIAEYGISAYDPIKIAEDLNVDVSKVPTSAVAAFELTLTETLSTTFSTLNITTTHTSDELFDCSLTFFESLHEYKDDFKTIYFKHTLNLNQLSFLPVFQTISQALFQSQIITFLDKATYSLILIKLFHTWIQDTSHDLANTSHAINQLCHSIFYTC